MKTIHAIKVIMLFTFSLISTSCISEKKLEGYQNLDLLYSDFVHYLKIGGEDLKTYCYKICPDQQTVNYMKKHNINYRGIPEKLESKDIDINLIGQNYFKLVNRFRDELIINDQLDNLVYIGREKLSEELYDQALNVYATETFILLKSNNDTIKCKLGEMFNFGGQWKSFTQPKLGW